MSKLVYSFFFAHAPDSNLALFVMFVARQNYDDLTLEDESLIRDYQQCTPGNN